MDLESCHAINIQETRACERESGGGWPGSAPLAALAPKRAHCAGPNREGTRRSGFFAALARDHLLHLREEVHREGARDGERGEDVDDAADDDLEDE